MRNALLTGASPSVPVPSPSRARAGLARVSLSHDTPFYLTLGECHGRWRQRLTRRGHRYGAWCLPRRRRHPTAPARRAERMGQVRGAPRPRARRTTRRTTCQERAVSARTRNAYTFSENEKPHTHIYCIFTSKVKTRARKFSHGAGLTSYMLSALSGHNGMLIRSHFHFDPRKRNNIDS